MDVLHNIILWIYASAGTGKVGRGVGYILEVVHSLVKLCKGSRS